MNDLIKIRDRINEYQTELYFHPFTCRADGCRNDLVAEITGDDVVLVCPGCGLKQEEYPLMELFEDDEAWDEIIKSYKELREILRPKGEGKQ
jgi:hypothetical protein